VDKDLDRTLTGPHWLKKPEIAERVVELMVEGDAQLGYFSLCAFVVMPNHIHILLTPKLELRRIMNGLKGATARDANRILNRTGKPFWQDESYDHCVRSDGEFGKICRYIENNPVSAGLVRRPEDWP
jgi:putative transposase